jgi:type IV secretion system protein VirB1
MTLIALCTSSVPAPTLAAIVAHESAGNRYAVNLNSPTHRVSRTPTTEQEAIGVLKTLAQGNYGSFDIGLAQINSIHLKRFGLAATDLLDPCTNLRVGARILGECYLRTSNQAMTPQHRLASALSCYNTGSLRRGFRNGYVKAVYREAANPKKLDVPTTHSAPLIGPNGPAITIRHGESLQ